MLEISLADVNAKVKQKVEKRYRVATYKLKHFKNSTKNLFQKIFKVARCMLTYSSCRTFSTT